MSRPQRRGLTQQGGVALTSSLNMTSGTSLVAQCAKQQCGVMFTQKQSARLLAPFPHPEDERWWRHSFDNDQGGRVCFLRDGDWHINFTPWFSLKGRMYPLEGRTHSGKVEKYNFIFKKNDSETHKILTAYHPVWLLTHNHFAASDRISVLAS